MCSNLHVVSLLWPQSFNLHPTHNTRAVEEHSGQKWTQLLDREVGTTRKRQHKAATAEQRSGSDTESGSDVEDGAPAAMDRSVWQQTCNDFMRHGYNPEKDEFDLLQANGIDWPHPMQLPTKSYDHNLLMSILKSRLNQIEDVLFEPPTAKNVNINELIRKLDTNSHHHQRCTGFTFYPGKAGALHPKVPNKNDFFSLHTLMNESYFTWTFAPCSMTVQGFVESMAKKSQLEVRIGQLLGFISAKDTFMQGRILVTVSVFAWIDILFAELWALLVSNIDSAEHISRSSKVHWRSLFADRHLSALEAMTMTVYLVERVIYTDPTTPVVGEFEDKFSNIDKLVDYIETALLKALPTKLAVARREPKMWARILTKFKSLALSTTRSGRFCTYRYFLGTGKPPAGTGDINAYTIILLYIYYVSPCAVQKTYRLLSASFCHCYLFATTPSLRIKGPMNMHLPGLHSITVGSPRCPVLQG